MVRQALLSSCLNQARSIEIIPFDTREDTIRGVIEGLWIGTYRWDKYKSDSRKHPGPNAKDIHLVTPVKREYHRMITICQGVTLTRDLVNDNADTVNSTYLEKTIRALCAKKKNIKISVFNKKELQAKKLNLILAVNKGSRQEPKLIIVQYQGAPKKQKPIALVGKGITFDSGGLNLKTSGHIETMRCDMAGAAALIGVLKNTIELQFKKNILFVFGLAENAIGSNATKPGDIITGYSGKTVEIANTDAEGRLVLADAIAYTVKNYHPERIIDVATLTGACIVALGYDHTGLVSSHAALARNLLAAAQKTDDRAWQLPSYPEIKDSVKSHVADIRNIGYPRGAGGTITAAEFLRQFTNDVPWAHLDIAGTAFIEERQHLYYDYGATGAGVRLLCEYLTKG